MTIASLEKLGQVFEQNYLSQEPGMVEAGKFLHKFGKKFVQVCTRFDQHLGDMPIYLEREVQSIVLPAMYQVADTVWTEYPIKRRRDKKSSNGRLDYWVQYGGHIFLIELKLDWVSTELDSVQEIRRELDFNWSSARKQLKTISKADRDSFLVDNNKQMLEIALFVVVGYRALNNEKSIRYFSDSDLEKLQSKLVAALVPRPNWTLMWAFPERMQKYEYDEGYSELSPGLGIMALVDII